MAEGVAGGSARLKARVAGGLYVVVIATALFAEVFVRGSLIAPGDGLQTAGAILAHQDLWRQGYAADLVSAAAYVGVTLLLYDLLRPVNASLALAAAFFGLLGSAIMVVSLFGHFAPLLILDGGDNARLFAPEQLGALVRVALRLHAVGYNTSILFFGCQLVGVGWLVYRSKVLPRILGVLLPVAGLLGILHTFAVILSPSLAAALDPVSMISSLLAEGGLALWLLVMGVKPRPMDERVTP
jgi:hypothetical protein